MASRITFFASGGEQARWLGDALHNLDGWCVADHFSRKEFQRLAPRDAGPFLFQSDPRGFRFFFGRSDLCAAPMWRAGRGGKQLDAIRSRAIHYVPSFTVGRVLVEGVMDILGKSYYEEAGIEYMPLRHWFVALRRSLEKSLRFDGAQLLVPSGDGKTMLPASAGPRVVVSRDTVVWRQQGGQLKQVADSRVEFDVLLP